MKIFIDFDDTIFAKSDLKKVIDHELRKKFGLTQHIIDQSYDTVKRSDIEYKGLYTIAKHVEILSEMTGIDIESLGSFFEYMYSGDLSEYIHNDVAQTLKKLNDHQRILLTFGDREFQTMKIENTGVRNLFDDVIVTQRNKYDAMSELVGSDDTLVLIDDKMIYFSDIKSDVRKSITIHMHSQNVECTAGVCDYHIVRFGEICDILAT